MKYLFLLLICFSSFNSFAQKNKKEKVYPRLEVMGSESDRSMAFEAYYKTYEDLVKECKKKGEVQLWDSIELGNQLELVPKGGRFTFVIKGVTLEHSNLKWWSFVFQDTNGEIIKRHDGESDAGNVSRGIYTSDYYNTEVISFNEPLEEQIKIFIIDKLQNIRSALVFYPKDPAIASDK